MHAFKYGILSKFSFVKVDPVLDKTEVTSL